MGGFANPIAGGVGTLIREFLRSANYVAGLAGWSVNRDGTAEFSGATVRGSVSAAGGTITLGDDGLHVDTADGDIYLSADNYVTVQNDNGAYVQTVIQGTDGALTLYQPPNVAGLSYSPGVVVAATFPLQDDAPVLVLISPHMLGPVRPDARVYVIGEDVAGNGPLIDLRAPGGATRVLTGDFQVHTTATDAAGITYLKGQQGVASVSVAAALSATLVVHFPISFGTDTPVVNLNIEEGAGVAAAARWQARAISISPTQFTLYIFAVNPLSAATFTADVSWSATVPG